MTERATEDETALAPHDSTPAPDETAGGAPERPDGPTVQIAYLHSSRVSHSWHQSMMNLIAYDKSMGSNAIRSMPYAVSCSGPNSLVEGRNMAVEEFLNGDADYLMFIDTDMGFQSDSLDRLLFAAASHSDSVVGGLCFAMKHVKSDGKGGFRVIPVPTLFRWAKDGDGHPGFANRFIYPPDSLVQVAGTGAAFLLIPREVLLTVGSGWFDFVRYEDGTQVSEDLSFCYRVNQAGFPIIVHTGVKISHHKEIWLDEHDYSMPDREPARKMMAAAKPQTEQRICPDHGGQMLEGLDGWRCACTFEDLARTARAAQGEGGVASVI